MHRILIVDDDVAVTNYLMVFLMQTERFETTVINDSREVPPLLTPDAFDVAILDMDMPNVTGMDILRLMHERGIQTPVIVLTGVSDVDLAVKAMKLAAFDYLTKPVDDDHLLQVIDSALEHRALHSSIEQLPPQLKREDLAHRAAFDRVPAQNPVMIRLLHQAEKMALGDLTIFLWGERGTGKEMLARAIHHASPRHDEPFVAVDAAAQDPAKFPADFFGQARVWSGAVEERSGFLESAAGGTLYLGEVEYLTLPMQVRVKRALQTGEYYRENSTQICKATTRFIVTSSHDLTRDAYQDTFSRDLLYHLMVNSIRVPPLRDRKEDIPLLAEAFLERAMEKTGRRIAGFDPEYFEFLSRYDFPDNIQELRNIVEGSVVNAEGPRITVESLPQFIRQKIATRGREVETTFRPRRLDDVVREYVARTVEHCEGDRERAARELGVAVERVGEILGG
jgi:two-component system NtrC family response regulator